MLVLELQSDKVCCLVGGGGGIKYYFNSEKYM